MLLIYEDEQIYGDKIDDPALLEIVDKHRAFAGGLGPAMKGGAGLNSTATATTVRTTGGSQSIHDGPFAETKEQLGGFYIVETPDLDAAIEMAKRVPLGRDGAIEIRPLLTEGDEGGA
jgi:hypothetical protein